MKSVIMDPALLKVVEVYPYTRSQKTKQVTQQPTIIMEDCDGTRYILSGMKVLYSFLNQVMGPTYYRTNVKDNLYYGPTYEFTEILQGLIYDHNEFIVFNLSTPEAFLSTYGRPPMVNTRTMAYGHHNIVQTVTSMTQDSTLTHIRNVMQNEGVTLKYDGSVNQEQMEGGKVTYRFIGKSGEYYQHLHITVGVTGTMIAEPFLQHESEGYELSPFDQLLKMTEQNPGYLGPWLNKIQRGLDDCGQTLIGKHQRVHARIQAAWEREVEGWTETRIGRQRMMSWRNKAYRYGGLL